MKYKKIMNLLGNELIQASKFRPRGSTEIKDDLRGMFNTNIQVKLRSQCWNQVFVITVMLILVNGTITITGAWADAAARQTDERKKTSNIQKLCTIYWLHKQTK